MFGEQKRKACKSLAFGSWFELFSRSPNIQSGLSRRLTHRKCGLLLLQKWLSKWQPDFPESEIHQFKENAVPQKQLVCLFTFFCFKVSATFSNFCEIFSGLSTLPENTRDSRFWTVSPGLQIKVWNLKCLPFLVDSTFWQWTLKYFALFELFFC